MSAVTRLQILRGTTSQRLSFIPLAGELIMDLDSNFLYIGNGVTAGGVLAAPLAAATDKIIAIFRNNTGATITKGTPVYITGSIGGLAAIAPCDASNATKVNAVGIVELDIANNTSGTVVVAGRIGGMNTSSYADGDELYIAAGGGLTKTKPVLPNFIEAVAKCVIAHPSNGSIEVHLEGTAELPNLPNNHVPIGQTGGNTTTVDFDTKTSASPAVAAAMAHIANTSNPHNVTKAQVGLGNVDNTSDVNKPVSTAQAAADAAAYAAAIQRANHTGTQLASTISDFAATVIAAVLTGFVVGTNAAIAATDTILQAFGKVQAQINNLLSVKADKTITITGTDGLAGGGDLSANRTLNLPNVITAGTVGATNRSLSVTVDAKGRVTALVANLISIVSSQISDLANTVLNTVLTGLTFPYDTAVVATDTILQAIGKLQGQIDVWTENIVAADFSNTSNTTWVTVSDFNLPVVAGRKYYIELTMLFRSASTTNGIGFTAANLNTAAGTISLIANIPSGADGTNSLYAGSITSFGDAVTSTAVEAANTDYVAKLQGVFVCTASGDIGFQFRSELNGTQSQVKAGSVQLVREFQ